MLGFIYLTPIFLYFPRFLPSVETQPLLATGVAILGLLLGHNRRAPLALVLLALALLLWISVKIGFDGAIGSAVGLLQILVGPIILFGALALRAPPPSRKMMASVAIFFLACATFEIFAPNSYGMLATALLSRASVSDGHRGVSLFTPEPTYAAISAVYFFVLAWWSGKHWGFRYRWTEPALAFCLLVTGSTYVGLLLLAPAYVRWPRKMILGTVATIVTLQLIGLVTLENDESIRAVVAISRLLTADFSDFLPSISILDSSLGSRLTINAASYLTPLHSPLGLGLDCAAVPNAFLASGFDFALDNTVLSEVMYEGCLKPQSYAATIALGLGVMSFVFILLLIALSKYINGHVLHLIWAEPLALAVMLLVVQSQVTNPIPWLLIFIALSDPSIHPLRRHRIQPMPYALHSPK